MKKTFSVVTRKYLSSILAVAMIFSVTGYLSIYKAQADDEDLTPVVDIAATPGSITVTKDVIDSNGNDVEDDTSFTVCLDGENLDGEDCQSVSEGNDLTFSDLSPGDYTVTEEEQDGFTLDSYSSDSNPDLLGAQVTVLSGLTFTLNIVNKQEEEETGPAHIIVKKQTNLEEEGPTEFNFSVTGEDYDNSFVLSDGEESDQEVAPGTYTITEGADYPGWTLNNVSCLYDNEEAGQEAPHGHTVELGAGHTVTCTFSNSYYSQESQGHLIVKKVLVGASRDTSPSDFEFSINEGDNHSFDGDGENDITLTPGTYTVTEPSVRGYTTTYDNCSNLEIANGETLTCTITNTVPSSSGDGSDSHISGHHGGGGGGQGSVLGASTGPESTTTPAVCEAYLSTYLKFGVQNPADQVMKLQTFLNEFQNSGLAVNGIFDEATLAAVRAFQVSQVTHIRDPWVAVTGPVEGWPTGYVYKTTLWWINTLKCPTGNYPLPILP